MAGEGERSKKGKKGKGDGAKAVSDEIVPGAASALVAAELERLTGIEVRVTVLGYVQRGGAPTPQDRLLATKLGAKAAELLAEGTYGVMVAVRGEGCEAAPLEDVAGQLKLVPEHHPLVDAARGIGVCLGE